MVTSHEHGLAPAESAAGSRRRARLLCASVVLATVTALASGPVHAEPQKAAAMVDPNTPNGVRPVGGSPHATLVFSDEFYGAALDTSKWTAKDEERSDGSYFRDWWKPANVRVNPNPQQINGGNLWINLSQLATDQYATGEIESRGKFDHTYGTVEWRAQMPPTEDHFGALWRQPTNGISTVDGTARDGGEYDVVESYYQGDRYANTIHYDGYGADHKVPTATINAPNLHTGYHTYAMEWTPTSIKYRYDGGVIRTITDPNLISQVPQFPVISHEAGAWVDGAIANAPMDWRSNMYVDYIRIWQ
ncbi:glycoside hydrolase family 16 protein [Streptomyces sp. NBC_00259]|uniref:glycoside hydrolase family 16 protein n=1 Tax=Streptomyces sp. NBC_00259 TaxID=2903643 RepID=UPI002E2B9E28|nr:glycoside hydrolase family 16 protein [Streptomyces sp. NBC_00259]